MRGSVAAVELPADAQIAGALARVDYADAFALRGAPVSDAESFALALFARPPAWIASLMRLRDAAVGLVGLKTSPRDSAPPKALPPGARIAIFEVFARTPEEVVLGADDRHLDFRVSALCRGGGAEPTAIVSTVVQFHSVWGRLYFWVVRPFHRRIVRSLLARVAGG